MCEHQRHKPAISDADTVNIASTSLAGERSALAAISVTQIGGGLFTFTALDFASNRGPSDGVDLIGLVNGVQTSIFPNLTSGTTTFSTLNPLFLTPIDELRIVGASQSSATLILDNFVFNPVRDTGSTFGLLALALAGLFGASRVRSIRLA